MKNRRSGMPGIPAVVGPTASGKTKLSIILAEKIHGEIISADSRQVYKLLNIGTAKPDYYDLQRVTHHFINMLNPDQEYNAAKFGTEACAKISNLIQEGIQPVVAGGSGLYIRSLIDGFFEGPGKDPEIRQRLENEVKECGADRIYERLKKIDPVSAAKMDVSKVRRIIRALEVYYITGKPISEFHTEQNSKTQFEFVQYGLEWERKILYERINRRVDEMVEKGLIEEVKDLKSKGYTPGLNALNSVGYKEVFEFLEGKITKEEMIKFIKQNTRHFAKRQLTWFKADKRIHWIQISEKTNWNELAEVIKNEFLGTEQNVLSVN